MYAFLPMYLFVVYRGFYFIIIHAHRLGFHSQVHPTCTLNSPSNVGHNNFLEPTLILQMKINVDLNYFQPTLYS